ncbi:MAG: thymidylate synthase, partial [Gammaproteobacteria bacterium]|nr:thymidylate synthase [Gammaproteobacteria bacterium]NIW42317.1 thymidylate synthase [candidate division Zixibacteria bacterium]NIX55468.1 thymidylate synthase [candidate division Zixibacteria bacterium]
YLDTLQKILEDGVDRPDRTGVGTRACFGLQMRFNMTDGFPAVTTKKLAFKSMAAELLWFIGGSRNVKELQELGSHIWDAN